MDARPLINQSTFPPPPPISTIANTHFPPLQHIPHVAPQVPPQLPTGSLPPDDHASSEPQNSKRRRTSGPGSRGVNNLTPEQLAKKRANDREAQRAIRERTKSQIEALEKKIQDLTSQKPYQELQDALRQKEAVEAENADIKRRLASIQSLIQPILANNVNRTFIILLICGANRLQDIHHFLQPRAPHSRPLSRPMMQLLCSHKPCQYLLQHSMEDHTARQLPPPLTILPRPRQSSIHHLKHIFLRNPAASPPAAHFIVTPAIPLLLGEPKTTSLL